ncbi:Dihydroorotase [compost metagenome]
MTEFGLLQEAGAVAFTNGRHALSDSLLLRRAMTYAREFDAVISLELRDKYLGNGVMNEGLFASWLGLSGVPKEAEIIPLERDLRIAALTKAKYHAAKISVPESVEAMKVARGRGANVTCGISINHLSLNENDIGEYRTFFKLSPPLRTEDDRVSMADALAAGDIDIIVSSHDPQDVDTKRLPFADAADGAIGLETMLSAALRLHHDGRVPLMRLIDAMSTRPAHIFGLDAGTLKVGAKADITLIDLDDPWIVSKDAILSRSKNTPFDEARFSGRAVATYVAGKCVHAIDGGRA